MKDHSYAGITLMCTLVLACSVWGLEPNRQENSAPNDSVVQRIYIDRSSSHDPGTIVAILNNTGDHPISVGKIIVNGVTVKDWQDPSAPVLWHRITRSELEPGQSSLIFLKLAQYSSGMIRVEIQIAGRMVTNLLNASKRDPVRVIGIRYDPEGKNVNMFLRNFGQSQEIVQEIRLDAKKIWTAPEGGVVIPSGATVPCRISLNQSLKAGQILTFYVTLKDRILGVRDRAIPGFRISIESGDLEMAERIAADPLVLDSFQFRQENLDSDSSHDTPSLESLQGKRWSLVSPIHGGTFVSKQKSDLVCAMACVAHATDSYHTSAYLAMMAQREVEEVPAWQSFIHACRSQPLRGLAMFGQIADSVRFNAQLDTAVSGKNAKRDNIPWTVYQLTRYAVSSASPSVALPVIPLEKDRSLFKTRAPLPMEAKQMIYAAISAGPGGLAYRVMEKDWGKEARDEMIDEVTKTNQEIRQVRDYLAVGFPRPIASSSDPYVQVACIDAAPKGLLLVLINHDVQRSSPELPPSMQVTQHRDVKIDVTIPNGFAVDDIRSINGKESSEIKSVTEKGNKIVLNLLSIDATKLVLIKLKEQKADG